MHNNEIDFSPIGERFIAKKECLACCGKGHSISEVIQMCSTCKGLGYTESPENDVQICKTCKGERSVISQIKIACKECNTRGYIPQIMQKFEATQVCGTCEGNGEINTDDYEEENCDSCECTGRIKHSTCPLTDWKNSPLNDKTARQVVWSTNPIDDACRTENGFIIKVDWCPECRDTVRESRSHTHGLSIYDSAGENDLDDDDPFSDEDFCETCKGEKKVISIYTVCAECDGNGVIAVYDTEECPDCEGAGKFVYTEDREV